MSLCFFSSLILGDVTLSMTVNVNDSLWLFYELHTSQSTPNQSSHCPSSCLSFCHSLSLSPFVSEPSLAFSNTHTVLAHFLPSHGCAASDAGESFSSKPLSTPVSIKGVSQFTVPKSSTEAQGCSETILHHCSRIILTSVPMTTWGGERKLGLRGEEATMGKK